MGGRNLDALRFSQHAEQAAFKDSRDRQVVGVVAFLRERHRLRNALAGYIGAAQGPREVACRTESDRGRAENVAETRRAKKAAPSGEMLLGIGEVAAKQAHLRLSTACEGKARGTALTLGKSEYPVRQQG